MAVALERRNKSSGDCLRRLARESRDVKTVEDRLVHVRIGGVGPWVVRYRVLRFAAMSMWGRDETETLASRCVDPPIRRVRARIGKIYETWKRSCAPRSLSE